MDLSWWPLFSALFHIGLQVGLAVRLLLRRQPLANTHAWLLLVFFVPVLGIVFYLLVGEIKLGSRRVRNYERAAEEIEPWAQALWTKSQRVWDSRSLRFYQLACLGENICDMPAVVGNDLELLTDAATTLDTMIADIDAAESHCHLLSYILHPRGKPVELCEALMRAAERGVECRVALDSAGSRAFFNSELCAQMRSRGVQVLELLRVNPIRLVFRRLDLRNHRKIFVIDGKTAYCGSHNITDDTFRPAGPEGPGPWHDATVRLQGYAARALALVFAADWNSEASRPLHPLDPYLPEPMESELALERQSSSVQLLPSGPGARPQAIQSATVATMYSAYEELIVTTPYFVPDITVLTALTTAAARGVRVVLILPKKNNARLVDHAGRASYDVLLESGVSIMHYRLGLLHSKTITVDREIALIGSANLDQRSFWINFEITMTIYDTDFASRLRLLQQNYMDSSDEVDLAAWRERPIHSRLADNVAKLFSPLL